MSCPKSGSSLAFIRAKKPEQTQWLEVQEMHRPSAEILFKEGWRTNWTQTREAATKKKKKKKV